MYYADDGYSAGPARGQAAQDGRHAAGELVEAEGRVLAHTARGSRSARAIRYRLVMTRAGGRSTLCWTQKRRRCDENEESGPSRAGAT